MEKLILFLFTMGLLTGCTLSVQVSDLSALTKDISIDAQQSTLKFSQSDSSSVRLVGVCAGVEKVKAYTLGVPLGESLCTSGTWTLNVDLSSLSDGSSEIDLFGDTDASPRISVAITKDSQVDTPAYDSFPSPGTNFSHEPAPQLRLKSLEIGSDIKIYTDSGCTTQVGGKIATSVQEDIPLTFSSFGRYNLFVAATDELGNSTGCTTLSTQYYYAKKFDISATTDSNNDDQTLDGVCSDSTGKCSIKAAIDEMIGSFSTVPVLFNLETGLYNYSASKLGTYYYLKIIGNGPTNTEIRGGGVPFFLSIGYLLVLEDITFSQFAGSSFDIFSNSGLLEYKISRAHFKNNTAGTYGVISGRNGFEITDSLFDSNTSGSAFYARNSAGSIKSTTFLNNSSIAVQVRGSSQVSIQNSLIYGNTTGVYINGGLKTEIFNSLIIGNSSAGISSSSGPNDMALNIYNTTLNENGAAANGNLNIVGPSNPYKLSINAFNSVFAINSTKANCNTLSGNYEINFSNSLLDEATCPNIGTSVVAPPLLGAITLQGLSLNAMPQTGSPLIDGGSNNLCQATDYRGSLRPVKKVLSTATCDIGAIEVQAAE